jgi:exosome complex component RRP41
MGGRDSDLVLLDENGIRCDGRKVDETRNISIKAGVLKNANGSAYIEFGDNKILAGVFGPRDVHPKHMSDTDTGIIRCRYHMSPFSVTERKNPAPSRREIEIGKVIKEALRPAVMMFMLKFFRQMEEQDVQLLMRHQLHLQTLESQ